MISVIAFFLSLDRSVEVKLPDSQAPPPHLKLAIINGCGIDGVAGDVKEWFIHKSAGNIDVVSCKNVDRNLFIYNRSIIVVKKDDAEKLRYLMNFTGITRKILAIDNNAIEDLQIILGNDYKLYFE